MTVGEEAALMTSIEQNTALAEKAKATANDAFKG
jgi:hypothetical protein